MARRVKVMKAKLPKSTPIKASAVAGRLNSGLRRSNRKKKMPRVTVIKKRG
jgi:hypothetical protein